VFLAGVGLLTALLYTFIRPLVEQTTHLVDNVPEYLADARAGRGPVGSLVERFELDRRFAENQQRLSDAVTGAGARAVDVAGRLFAGVVSLVTVLVLAFMMILYGPDLLRSVLATLPPERRERVSKVAADCAKALTGYVMGNLLISVVAGAATFVVLSVVGVPFPGVLALWVAFADLIPLVGATLGAIPAVTVAFLHSVPAGIAVVVFYVVYQQFENHFLQPLVMSRTVQINQLFVLVSVLIGVELSGILGALMAIPLAGVIQVIVRDLWDHRRGQLKPEPTLGADGIPVSEAGPELEPGVPVPTADTPVEERIETGAEAAPDGGATAEQERAAEQEKPAAEQEKPAAEQEPAAPPEAGAPAPPVSEDGAGVRPADAGETGPPPSTGAAAAR
jgi:predicted PurR-regulated permease PerM